MYRLRGLYSFLIVVLVLLSMELHVHALPHKVPLSAEMSSSEPVITTLTPSSAFVGDTVEIRGSGFGATNLAASKVFFVNRWYVLPSDYEYDSLQAEILFVNDTTISAIVPLGATQGVIAVSLNGQFATSMNSLSYNVIPTLESLLPDSGYVGDTVTITGTGFDAWHPESNRVWFTNGNNTYAIDATETSIDVIVPTGTTTGPVTVFTNTPRVTSTFNFHVLPAITYLGQLDGQVGTEISIYGNGFDPTLMSEYHLTFNGTPATISRVTSYLIYVIVPSRATSGLVRMVYNNTEVKGSGIYFSVIPEQPVINDFTPNSGTIGTSVLIHGSEFDQGGPPLTVSFGGGIAAEIDSFTNRAIYTKVPLGAQSGPVTITAGGRSSDGGPSFRVIETIFDMEPKRASVGDTILVTGTGFATYLPDYYTIFLNTAESIHPISVTDTALSFVVPPDAFHSFEPLITSSYYLGTNFKLPLLSIIPLITSIEPDTVITGREMEIRIHGTGFPSGYLSERIAVFFSNGTVQPITSQNTYTSFAATVPRTVGSGVVPVSVRIDSLLSLSVNLVVLPDTFPYTPRHPEIFGATDFTTTSFRCFWSSSYRALGYILDVTTDDFITFLPGYESLVLTDTSKIISGLEPGTRYGFRIRPYSDTDTATHQIFLYAMTLPLAPVAVPAIDVSEAGFIICRWLSVKGADGYFFEASENSFETFISAYIPEDTTAVLSIMNGHHPSSISYRVRAGNSSGLSDYSNVITLLITSARNETAQVTFYPNPAKDQVFITGLYGGADESRVIDVNGKVMPLNMSNVNDNTHSIDIRGWPNGLYILQTVVNHKVVLLKFIKQ